MNKKNKYRLPQWQGKLTGWGNSPIPSAPAISGSWPKISVITPSYNQVDYIEATIRSVLQQNYPNLEYLIIDGGSTDGSVDIIKKYEPWIDYWISEPDEGQTHAINKGVKKASGEWLIFLNSDDIFYPGALIKAGQKALEKPDSDWIAGNTQVFGENEFYNVKKPDKQGIDKPENWITYRVHVPQHASFVRRKVYKQLGTYNEDLQYVFDLEFGLRLGLHGYQPEIIDTVLAGFRIHDLSKTKNSRLPFLREQKQLINLYSEYISADAQKKSKKILHRMMASSTIYDAIGNTEINRKKMIKALFEALTLNSSIIGTRYFWGAVKKIILYG